MVAESRIRGSDPGLSPFWLLVAGFILKAVLLGSLAAAQPADSATGEVAAQSEEPAGAVDLSWGGHVKLRGSASRADSDAIWSAVESNPLLDGNAEGRLNNTLFLGEALRFDTQYETVWAGGDTRRAAGGLSENFPGPALEAVRIGRVPDDRTQVMDLTSVIDEDERSVWYHRIDRLVLGVSHSRGVVRIGRQAVTWGNGLVFNPMDLFSPFRPTDIEREYKPGTDLVYAQLPWPDRGNLQLLYVPRRNPATGDIDGNQSSLAGNLHLFKGTTEFDLLAAKHYEDFVLGAGSIGYLGSAAWRVDATWTILDSDSPSANYLSVVANLDRSWVWWRKNFYGFLEFYYNGLGENDYRQALANPDILKRLERGELFVLGRTYLAALIQIELHPLFNVFVTDITNLKDPSGILQPRGVWDFAPDFQLIFGANLFYGARGTEYGGIDIPGTAFTTRTPDSAYLWLNYYF
jgi:hypothetical protein